MNSKRLNPLIELKIANFINNGGRPILIKEEYGISYARIRRIADRANKRLEDNKLDTITEENKQ